MQATARKKGFGINFCWGAKLLLWVYNHQWKKGSLTRWGKSADISPCQAVPHSSPRLLTGFPSKRNALLRSSCTPSKKTRSAQSPTFSQIKYTAKLKSFTSRNPSKKRTLFPTPSKRRKRKIPGEITSSGAALSLVRDITLGWCPTNFLKSSARVTSAPPKSVDRCQLIPNSEGEQSNFR